MCISCAWRVGRRYSIEPQNSASLDSSLAQADRGPPSGQDPEAAPAPGSGQLGQALAADAVHRLVPALRRREQLDDGGPHDRWRQRRHEALGELLRWDPGALRIGGDTGAPQFGAGVEARQYALEAQPQPAALALGG